MSSTIINPDTINDGIDGALRFCNQLLMTLLKIKEIKALLIGSFILYILYLILRNNGFSRNKASFITDFIDIISSLFGK
jgi:hypothetical protein